MIGSIIPLTGDADRDRPLGKGGGQFSIVIRQVQQGPMQSRGEPMLLCGPTRRRRGVKLRPDDIDAEGRRMPG